MRCWADHGWTRVVLEELTGVEQVEWARRQTNWRAGHEWKIDQIVQSRSSLSIDKYPLPY